KGIVEKLASEQAALDSAWEEISTHWTRRFAAAPLTHLSPEQLGWTILRATGMMDRQRAASAAEINKKTPLKPEEQQDPAKVAARAQQIEQAALAKLQASVDQFVKLFGAGSGQPQHEFFATVDQALFFSNGSQLSGWLAPNGDNLTGRLLKIEDPAALSEELYLSLFTRKPTSEEAARVASYLAARPQEKTLVVREMAWALLTSAEFRFRR
ncbi:MAG: DUF1553 domain-containing protein, partial [Planctomycetales bacterium]